MKITSIILIVILFSTPAYATDQEFWGAVINGISERINQYMKEEMRLETKRMMKEKERQIKEQRKQVEKQRIENEKQKIREEERYREEQLISEERKIKNDQFINYFNVNVSGWKTIDNDPSFYKWLANPVPYTNTTKFKLLKTYIDDFNAPMAAQFFIDYKTEMLRNCKDKCSSLHKKKKDQNDCNSQCKNKYVFAEEEIASVEKNIIEMNQDAVERERSSPVAGEISKDVRFVAYDDGTIFDKKTLLMWASKDNGSSIDWQKAKSYCENYKGGGYSDWRMPTLNELSGLYDESMEQKSGYHLTDLIRISHALQWSSETKGSEAAAVYFLDGDAVWTIQSNASYRVLPVRNAK